MFYSETGEPLSIKEFIAHYEPYYFIGSASPKPQNKTSRFLESEIEKILQRGVELKDIPLIIAWKVGLIDNDISTNSVVYKGDFPVTLVYDEQYYNGIDLNPMIIKLSLQLEQIKGLSQISPYEAYKTLYEMRVPYFGSVKVLTLLYFLSQGKSPIYDKYAEMALDAYLTDAVPGAVVGYTGLPGNIDGDMERYNEYITKLKKVFCTEDYTDRIIDRALWVYGHFFDDGKKSTAKKPNIGKSNKVNMSSPIQDTTVTDSTAPAGYTRSYWKGEWKQMGAEIYRGTKSGSRPPCPEFRKLSPDEQTRIFNLENLFSVLVNTEERVLILTFWRREYPGSTVEGYVYQAVEYDICGNITRTTDEFYYDDKPSGQKKLKNTEGAINKTMRLLNER